MAVNRDLKKNYFLGGGELFINRGNGFEYFGATDKMSINYKVDKFEHKNSEGEMLTLDMEVVKEVSAEVSFDTVTLSPEVLALAFGGDYTQTTQNAASSVENDFSGVIGGVVYELTASKVKNVVVSYNDGSEDVNAVENIDYSVDYEFGRIEIAKGGALDAKDIKVTFDNEATSITQITSLNNVSREVALRFRSHGQVGNNKETTIHKVNLMINGSYDLKSIDKNASLNFSGKVLKDTTKPEGKQFVETVIVGA